MMKGRTRYEFTKARLLKQKGFCALCHKRLALHEANLDHILPTSMGGRDYEWNLRVVHRSCNVARGNSPEDSPVYLDAYERHEKKGLILINVRIDSGGFSSSPLPEEERLRRVAELHAQHAESLRQYVPNP